MWSIETERGEKMLKDIMTISKDTEEKRLKDFQKIAENWDKLPEYAQGKLDGTISTLVAVYLTGDQKAG